MPSIVAHAVAGIAVASAVAPRAATRRVWIAAALCAALPDIDALGRPFGNLGYETAFGGHRGITHSLLFAIILGAVVSWLLVRGADSRHPHIRLWIALALATASHGVFDMLSVIGDGVAFWAPLTWTHYEFAWQPLGDLGPGPRGPARVIALVGNELVWVGLPAGIVMMISWRARSTSRAAYE
ncbi:MAG TPA: metal-dependent hydrolase [Gemmatimonadaceae bacterium]|nr:metal-dependent hydrolase [Gemmatimonadaceae bacterium]